ncbi:MAG: L-aspartate oxidase [Nitrospinae bacterium]|nr:L-aspartate oxidase [Nitrospinota bacterium]
MKNSGEVLRFDFIVVGSGLAGLVFALDVAKKGAVAVLTKREVKESNTLYAQGGIAAVTSGDDSFDLHVRDTLQSGAGLCREEAVKVLVEGGPSAIEYLSNLGAMFTRSNASPTSPLDLHREGGHSTRRVVHTEDLTGKELERALITAVKAEKNIKIFENHTAIDMVLRSKMEGEKNGVEEVIGVFALDTSAGEVRTFMAPATFLATGGCGKVYLYTSNPDVSSGDGMAMAYRAGARITNMEFMQFHPTIVYHPALNSFLISEAVRGEGAVLRLINGKTFMENYHPMASLATRDVVARAIDTEMKRRGDEFVYLDATGIGAEKIREKFPNICKTLLDIGIDMTREFIPVVPAAHHICGGVDVDLFGRTSIKGLYAGGENACTGVHGANRLASNSLLEAVVFPRRAAQKVIEEWGPLNVRCNNPWSSGDATDSDEQVVITQNWDEVRRLMWNYVGIVRSDKRLVRAQRRIKLFADEIKEYYRNFLVTSDLIELRNITACAELIIESALQRRESRGLHYNLDYPFLLPDAKETNVVHPVGSQVQPSVFSS